MDGHDPAADRFWYPDDFPREAASVAAAAGNDDFLDIEGLLGLAWEGAALEPPHASIAESPPSEDVMAAWLYPIVSGEDNAGDGRMLKSEPSTRAMRSLGTTESKRKLSATYGMDDVKHTNTRSDSSERRKAASGGSNRSRSSRHSETHNVIEKRRRCKINDRLRTLQQLVPGCENSNQASTLEQTIQYMKSLQQQVQAMNVRPAQAVYPAMQTASVPLAPPIAVSPGTIATGGRVQVLPAGMAPFGAMLPCPHYHAVMMPAPATAAPFYFPQPAVSAALEGQCSISTEHCS